MKELFAIHHRYNKDLLSVIGLVLVVCVVFVAATGQVLAQQRIVAIGDLHGDLENTQAVLKLVGLIDDTSHWSGTDTILVQTGDMVDRGDESKGVMDLLRRLKSEAESAGGQVINLLGNHELMNLQGDWRYVSKGDLAVFGGRTARIRAFSSHGQYGKWLASLQTAVQIGDTVFTHGGLLPGFTKPGLESLNKSVNCRLSGGDPDTCHLLPGVLGVEGPFWYRGYVLGDAANECRKLESTLEDLKARRMVVGHTTQRNGRILSRCAGKLAVIDIGISRSYGGHLGAWEWRDGNVYAVYPDETIRLQ